MKKRFLQQALLFFFTIMAFGNQWCKQKLSAKDNAIQKSPDLLWTQCLRAIEHGRGNDDMVKKLVELVNVNGTDKHGKTLLMSAVKHERMQLITLLLQHGAHPDAKDLRGWTALDYIQYKNRGILSGTFKIVALSTPDRKKFAHFTKANQLDYAKKHNYRYSYYERVLDPTRHPAFSKILALLDQIKKSNSEWLMWIDDDALITNKNVKLEKFVKDQPYDFIIAHDASPYPCAINSGVFLIKNNRWAKRFLLDVWISAVKLDCLWKPTWEQTALVDLLIKKPQYLKKTKILAQRSMNSFARPDQDESSKWQPGDFVAHVPNTPDDIREKIIKQLADNVKKQPIF